ncbi:hypothetical protein RD110_01005 [Rhodoferax koreense]|uniref:Uncharacterized protein n=1 Tax=Rhodoferax koreensis TaxID=1842727 RepID=A0A1P8JQB7_9BURK|nr:hypothetical protein [Rhodoferax koreense]APW35963.1 hypothetical protein RD110_01005 [Rhodoferax koreense]
MSDFLDHLSANDNDIYDLLISGRQKITENVLRELARDRGIFCSPQDSREDLADYLSILPHAFQDVASIVHKREPGGRKEKMTSIRLNVVVPPADLRAAVEEYIGGAARTERVTHRPASNEGFIVNVKYEEFNHSRARLLQRERQEADIEFFVVDGQTVVRMPATEKAKRIVEALKDNVERRRKESIQEEVIELGGLSSVALRSKFFTRLISTLDGFKLKNVMNLRVSSNLSEQGEDDEALDLEDVEESEARAEMFAVVHSMALSGQNLVQSQEYKDLTARGFYITSISWRSEQDANPPDIVQFEAGFQDRKLGTGFKYNVQGAFRAHKGAHRKTIAPVGDTEKAKLLGLIETTARKVLVELIAEDAELSQGSDGEQGEKP